MLLVIGLDGATFDLIKPWAAAGYLPTLSRLMAAGALGELTSTLPPVTAPAWASFMTGKNPGGHGVFDFFRRNTADLDDVSLVTAADVDGRFFWQYASDVGRRVGILNVPLTYPPRPLNGFLVPGLLSPDQGQTTYPPHFLQPYRAELGPYHLTPELLYRPGNETAFVAELRDMTSQQIQYALRLAQDQPLDFMMLHFLATDIAQHKLWRHHDPDHPWHHPQKSTPYRQAIRGIYQQIDEGIGRLLRQLPPDTTVLVMSDHGFGPQHRVVNLNLFLVESGFMTLKRGAGWRRRLFRHRGATAVYRRLFGHHKLLVFADVDWPRTQAYALGHMGQVYINLRGHEPAGTVSPDDYLQVRQQVAAALSQWPDPLTGRPFTVQTIPSEAAASGPYRQAGPDLHLILDGYRTVAYPMFAADGHLVTSQFYGDSGSHRRQGILIASGPPIQAGQQLVGARLIDLAPTILHLLDVPVPDDMDGRLLSELFTADFRQQHPLRTQPAQRDEPTEAEWTEAEQTAVTNRLRGLGYLG